jgi:type II secretory pathway component GspD/PulD (secretin)
MAYLFKSGVAITLSALCVGCTTPYVQSQVAERAAEAKVTLAEEKRSAPSAREDDGLHIRGIPVEYVAPPRGAVTLSVTDQPLIAVISSIAEDANYSAALASGVDARTPISVNLRGMPQLAAIREICFSAGLVAITDRAARTITVAKEGTYTYKLPALVVQALQSRIAMTGGALQSGTTSPGTGSQTTGATGTGSTQGAGAGSAGSGSSSSTSGSSAGSGTMTVSGGSDPNPRQLAEFLRRISGADVEILADQNLVMGRGNAHQLRRLQRFLETMSREALAQVEIEVSIIDVAVSSDIETGIDWSRAIGPNSIFGSATGAISFAAGNTTAGDGGRVAVTGRSIDAVVRALERVTSVREVVRTRVVTHSNQPTIFRNVLRRPFVPSAQTTVTPGQGNVVQSSAAVEYFTEGVIMSVRPSVLDSTRTSIMLMPVISNVTNVQTFNVGKDITLTAPVQPVQDAALNVIGQHNKTLVIAGLRTVIEGDTATGVPGLVRVPGVNWLAGGKNDRASARDLIMLVHSYIVPGPDLDVVVGEAL